MVVLYKAYSAELLTLLENVYNAENYDEKPCDKGLLIFSKYQATFALVAIIKQALVDTPDLDWKTEYDYDKLKNCLACYSIDFDAILTAASVA